eukprot:TRINITY_DN61453_c0_g1_i1.p1 TRINITY_DN61453_c0_g1~~TRINITY_DN61453_c0_g1_i1.p1  ORF type:complete len:952 (+),score=224.66 TRINITY_DN61453_c0_g1_i1:264-2858(+)
MGAEQVRPEAHGFAGGDPRTLMAANQGVATIVKTRGNQQAQSGGYPSLSSAGAPKASASASSSGPRPQTVVASGPTFASSKPASRGGMTLLSAKPPASSAASAGPAWGARTAKQPPASAAAAAAVPPKAWPAPKAPAAARPAKAKPKPKPATTGWDDEEEEEECDGDSAAAADDPATQEAAAPANRWNRQSRIATSEQGAPQPSAAQPKSAQPKSAPQARAQQATGSGGQQQARGSAQSNGSAATTQPVDAMSMAAAAAAAYSLPPGAHRWWQKLEGDCCPISLTSFEELTIDPFGLLGAHAEDEDSLPAEGIWGAIAEEMVRDDKGQSVHWFDGMFLASFLVSSGQLIDPVNRRPLSRGECKSLDEYLKSHGLPAVHVTDTFDLTQAVKSNRPQQASEGGDAARMAALEREAASMLRSLFDFRSAGIGAGSGRAAQSQPPPQPAPPPPAAPPPPPPPEAAASRQEAAASREWPGLGQEPATALTNRRTVHQDGGLQVVDDGEFEEGYEDEQTAPPETTEDEPTLADAAAAGPQRQKIARLPRSRGDGAQLTFAITGRVHAGPVASSGGAASSGSRLRGPAAEDSDRDSDDENGSQGDSVPAVALEVESWVPDWASPELHERMLAELDMVEAMYPDEYRLLTPDVRAHLQQCIDSGSVSRQPDHLRCEVVQHIDGAKGGRDVVIEFSLPPYYPLHEATLSLRDLNENREGEAGPTARVRAALTSLQATMRTDVLHSLEGSEVILRVLEWLTQHGPAEFVRCERGAEEQGIRAAAAVQQAAAAPAELTKEERIAQAKKERNAAKHSETWDLCAAFVQHGKCKNKNCQWRHEAWPDKDKPKKSDKAESEAVEKKAEAKPKAGKKKR